MQKSLSNFKRALWRIASGALFAVVCTGSLWAQERVVTGKVTSSEDNQGIPGVNIILKGTTLGTVTDADGKFSISAPSDAVLVFSSIGYLTTEMAVGAQSTIDIAMASDIKTLSEVIVTGYGVQEKRDVTAAIASVKGEALTRIANQNPLEGMKGQIAGVDILQTSGQPGAAPAVTIRGRRSINASNDPLFVVDGVPMTSGQNIDLNNGTSTSVTSPLNDINPSDIASVEVLKDAAATAIYGSRGANGVMLITTKRGKAGKTSVSYSGYTGVTQAFNQLPMMNATQFADMKREAARVSPAGLTGRTAWEGTIPTDDKVFIDQVEYNSVQKGLGTDWQNLVFQNGSQVNHQIGVSGGSEKTQVAMSVGYFKQGGTVPGMDFTRTTGRMNVDHQISKRFKAGMSNLFVRSVQNRGSNAVMSEAVNQTPLGLPYDASGNLIFLPISDAIRSNPLNELVPGKKVDEETINRIFSSAYIEADIIPGLKYKFLAGIDMRFNSRGVFDGQFTNSQKNGAPAAQYQNQSNQGYTLENLLTYTKTINDHNIGITALQSIQGNKYENHYTSVVGLPYEAQLWYNLNTAATINAVRSRLEQWSLASWMGRVNYAFKGKYLFQASLRADGSSRLSEGNKWTTFPGLSAGWRIKDEAFMSDVKVLSDLKLRASYGVVGNTAIDPYKTTGILQKSLYSWDEANAAGFALSEIPTPNLGWEKSATLDIGVEFGLFNGRLSGTLDVYQTNTTDLLLRRQIPASTGYDIVLSNAGASRTSGIELTLNANAFATQDFKWDIDFNFTSFKEEIVDLALRDANGNKASDPGNAWFIGQPIRVFYDYQKIGIWQKNETGEATAMMSAYPGEIKIKDQNGDGKITPDDRKVLGSDIPSAMGGLNNRFTYKGFDFSFQLYYRLGYMVNSQISADQNTMQSRYNNLAVDYWTINNPTNAFPKPNKVQETPNYASTLRYYDGGFVKLRTVTLGYNFSAGVLKRLGLSSMRVYVTAQNPLVWSSFTLTDPEANASLGSGTVPSNKVFLGGLNLTF